MLGAGFGWPHFLPFLPVHRSSQSNSSIYHHAAGTQLFRSGQTGTAWRLEQGVIRLDHADGGFASLAASGDILGCETLLFGQYTFTATALTPCLLGLWPGEGKADPAALLDSLAQAQRRAAELIALRGGQAIGRILSLIRLLADPEGQVVLPTRHDIAEITDLRFETVSRLLKSLQQQCLLEPIRIAGIHATRSFRLLPAAKPHPA